MLGGTTPAPRSLRERNRGLEVGAARGDHKFGRAYRAALEDGSTINMVFRSAVLESSSQPYHTHPLGTLSTVLEQAGR